MDAVIPEGLRGLFWDIDPLAIELPKHADYVIERIMTRGGWDAMCWLRRAFSRGDLAEFLGRKGARLPPRERAYWHLIATGSRATAVPGGGRPSWAGT